MRTYSELRRIESFEERFRYLSLKGRVGAETFGFDRYLNQRFYRSHEWRTIRHSIIVRDLGCDLGVEGYDIHSDLYIHHMNPITSTQLVEGDPSVLDPNFLITTTHRTHNAIHYGDENLLPRKLVERRPGDTKLWLLEREDRMPETDTNNPVSNPQWPNQKPIVDGVTPVTDVPQDPYLHVDTDDSLRTEMGV